MKLQKLTTGLITLGFVFTFSACTEKSKSEEEGRIRANAAQSSEELTEAAEQLVGPYTFMYADKIIDVALEKNPTNIKAQFYKSFLKRFMAFKGIVKRIDPLVRKGDSNQTTNFDRSIRNMPTTELKRFLLDGSEDIDTTSKLSKFLAEYVQALNDFRKFAKLNPEVEITLNMNPSIFGNSAAQDWARNCHFEVDNERKFKDIVCDTEIFQRKVNSADLIVLRQEVAGEMLYLSILTAYDGSLLEKLNSDESYAKMTEQQRTEYLNSLPSVAKLNANHTLNLIPELGSDYSAAIKWAMKYQDRLCPKGESTRLQRKGYLFDTGVCVNPSQGNLNSLTLLDQVLGGVIMAPINDKNDQKTDEIRVNLVGFLMNPPSDIRNVIPQKLDNAGKPTEWNDPTIGGLFPDGDIHKLNRAAQ